MRNCRTATANSENPMFAHIFSAKVVVSVLTWPHYEVKFYIFIVAYKNMHRNGLQYRPIWSATPVEAFWRAGASVTKITILILFL